MIKTLAQLRQGARQRADMSDDGDFVNDSEANDYVNEGISALHDIMIDADAAALASVHAPILTQVGDNAYTLPDDFYRLVSISYNVGGVYRPLKPGDVRHLQNYAARPPSPSCGVFFLRWQAGSALRHVYVYPTVNPDLLSVVYFPEATILSVDTDTFRAPNFWHEFVMVYAARTMMAKEEGDTTALEFRARALEDRIRDHMSNMDVGLVPQIQEVGGIHEGYA